MARDCPKRPKKPPNQKKLPNKPTRKFTPRIKTVAVDDDDDQENEQQDSDTDGSDVQVSAVRADSGNGQKGEDFH